MKIFHISDLHFGMHEGFLIEQFLKDFDLFKPDMILISGDVAHRARVEQYLLFNEFLKQLGSLVCMVPGNHDIPLHNIYARMFYPFKTYNTYAGKFTKDHFENEEIRVLGVNTVNPYHIKNGRMSTERLLHMKEYFSTPFKGLNIVFFHHNFDFFEGLHKPLENYNEFLSYLRESPIDVVCTGHSHYAHIGTVEKNNHHKALILHAGSLLCKRSRDGFNSYFFIETTSIGCTVHWRVFEKKSFQTKNIYTFNSESFL